MIYAIRAVGTQYVKIGYTDHWDAKVRLDTLQTGCPYDLELVAFGLGSKASEKRLHRYLTIARRHHKGEWFKWSQEVERVVAWIKDHAYKLPSIPRAVRGSGRLGATKAYIKAIAESKREQPKIEIELPESPKPVITRPQRADDLVMNWALKELGQYLQKQA